MIKGYTLATLSTFTAALMVVLAKIMVSDVHPLLISAVTYTCAFVLSILYFMYARLRPFVSPKSFLSGFFLSLYGALLYLSLVTLKASVGGLAIAFFPIFTSLFSIIIGEDVDRYKIFAALLSAISLGLVSLTNDLVALVMAITAAISLSFYTILLKGEPSSAFLSVFLASSFFSWIWVTLNGIALQINVVKVLPLGLLSFLGTIAWIKSVNMIGATRSSLTVLAYPLFVLILSRFMLGEKIGGIEILAYIFSIFALVLVILNDISSSKSSNE